MRLHEFHIFEPAGERILLNLDVVEGIISRGGGKGADLLRSSGGGVVRVMEDYETVVKLWSEGQRDAQQTDRIILES